MLAGWFIGDALRAFKAADRVVTVKGLAERSVPADLALWSISYLNTAPSLGQLTSAIRSDGDKIVSWLRAAGFTDEEFTRGSPQITDREAQNYGNPQVGDRYQALTVVMVRTGKVDRVRDTKQRSNDLVDQGIVLNRNYEYPDQYLFTQLNDIKPEMIAEATRNARAAAEQFAQDSGSEVGAIRSANQGYFSIEDRDPLSPEFKNIRVVTTVEYFLTGE